MTEQKTVHFVSLGCPKNLVDTEIMLGSLMKDGFQPVDSAEGADAIIVNTCGFIQDSKEESIRTLLDLGQGKRQDQTLIAAGCLTQRYKNELVEGLPEVDLFVGSGEFQNISEILKGKKAGNTRKDYFHLPTFLQAEETPRQISGYSHSAYLKISEGCKKRCSFCAIPLIRGNLQSRKLDPIIAEAQLLVAGGAKELIVISHDFTDYGWDLRRQDSNTLEAPLELLRRLSDESGARWIRVLYRYPDGIDEAMLKLMQERENLIPYFDMPLQHISDSVLKRMNRKMTRAEIEAVLKSIRRFLPNAVIRTQFIVGFPGETEDDFNELCEFVSEMAFDRVGVFQYSPEEGTPGAKMENQVSDKVKKARFEKLMRIQKGISKKLHKQFIGKEIEALVEGVSEETDLLLKGRSWFQAPEIDGVVLINSGTAKIGDLVRVRITDSHDYDLVGEILD